MTELGAGGGGRLFEGEYVGTLIEASKIEHSNYQGKPTIRVLFEWKVNEGEYEGESVAGVKVGRWYGLTEEGKVPTGRNGKLIELWRGYVDLPETLKDYAFETDDLLGTQAKLTVKINGDWSNVEEAVAIKGEPAAVEAKEEEKLPFD